MEPLRTRGHESRTVSGWKENDEDKSSVKHYSTVQTMEASVAATEAREAQYKAPDPECQKTAVAVPRVHCDDDQELPNDSSRGTEDPTSSKTCGGGERLSEKQWIANVISSAKEDTAVAEGGSKIQAVVSDGQCCLVCGHQAVNAGPHDRDSSPECDADYDRSPSPVMSPVSTISNDCEEATIHPPAKEVPVSATRKNVERSFGMGSGSITNLSLSAESIAREYPAVAASLKARTRSRSSRANAGSRRARPRSESVRQFLNLKSKARPAPKAPRCDLKPNPDTSTSVEFRSRGRARRPDAAEKSQWQCDDINYREATTRYYLNVGSGLDARDATNTCNPMEEAQPRVFQSVAPPLCNFMVSHIVSSTECRIEDLSRKLQDSGCNCTFVTLTVACYNQGWGRVLEFLMKAEGGHNETTAVADLLKEKVVYRVGKRAFAVVHKAKTEGCTITRAYMDANKQWAYQGGGINDRDGNEPDVELTTLELMLDVERQQRREMRIAYVKVSAAVADYIVRGLAQYIVENKLAMITGSFKGESSALGAALGRAGAVGSIPSHQAFFFPDCRQEHTHPSYFVFFGSFKEMSWPRVAMRIPVEFVLGEDIEEEMLPVTELPRWANNDLGSIRVPQLGNIKMKHTDFAKFCRGTFETTLWIGQTTPSKQSQRKNAWRNTQYKGKGKHKSTAVADKDRSRGQRPQSRRSVRK